MTVNIIYGCYVGRKAQPKRANQIASVRSFKKYFPPNYSDEQMRNETYLKGLELLRKPERTKPRRSLIRTEVYSSVTLAEWKELCRQAIMSLSV